MEGDDEEPRLIKKCDPSRRTEDPLRGGVKSRHLQCFGGKTDNNWILSKYDGSIKGEVKIKHKRMF